MNYIKLKTIGKYKIFYNNSGKLKIELLKDKPICKIIFENKEIYINKEGKFLYIIIDSITELKYLKTEFLIDLYLKNLIENKIKKCLQNIKIFGD